jgi:hypothetical protein
MKENPCLSLAAVLLFVTPNLSINVASNALPLADKFKPACSLPFQSIAVHHPIDTRCKNSGDAASVAGRNQNIVKNNLCASAPPIVIKQAIFDDLQHAVANIHFPFGNQHVTNPVHLASDRSPLVNLVTNSEGKKVGEGTLVRFVAFILETHHADVQGGESVNCTKPGKATNDIHIGLSEVAGVAKCKSVTAEIIPHFRPTAWDSIDSTTSAAKIAGHPVRFTGQMMFDASHSPCGDRHHVSSDPARRSNWEIHPVYAIDVCKNKTLNGCDVADESKWLPLDAFLSGHH